MVSKKFPSSKKIKKNTRRTKVPTFEPVLTKKVKKRVLKKTETGSLVLAENHGYNFSDIIKNQKEAFEFEFGSNISQSDLDNKHARTSVINKDQIPYQSTVTLSWHLHDPEVPDSQTDLNFPFSSDVMEDEGMEPIFHKQYQKVRCLDSPKMSISFTKTPVQVPLLRFQEDQLPFNNVHAGDSLMFTKMQQLCNSSVKSGTNFQLICPLGQDATSELILQVPSDLEKSMASNTASFLFNKSSSRKSRKNSRKNSSLENLKMG